MRIAVISDIHGNLVALEGILSDIAKSRVDQIVCLRDTVRGLRKQSRGYDLERLIRTIRVSGRPHAERMIGEYLRGLGHKPRRPREIPLSSLV